MSLGLTALCKSLLNLFCITGERGRTSRIQSKGGRRQAEFARFDAQAALDALHQESERVRAELGTRDDEAMDRRTASLEADIARLERRFDGADASPPRKRSQGAFPAKTRGAAPSRGAGS